METALWYAKITKGKITPVTRENMEVVYLKSTGIVRKVDELGRIVLPIELRRTLGISERDQLEIFVEGSSILLRKYCPACVFCDSVRDVAVFRGKNVCSRCVEELRSAVLPE